MSAEEPIAVISCYGCYRNTAYGTKNPVELPISSLASRDKFHCPHLREDGLCYALRGMGIGLTILDLLTSPSAHLLNILHPFGKQEFTVEKDWLLSKPRLQPCALINQVHGLISKNSWVTTRLR